MKQPKYIKKKYILKKYNLKKYYLKKSRLPHIIMILFIAVLTAAVIQCGSAPEKKIAKAKKNEVPGASKVEIDESQRQPWQIPTEVTVTGENPTLESLQKDFDIFSWESFIALNWPRNKDGSPDTHIPIGTKDLPTVWESWINLSQVFLEDGSPPSWDNRPLPSQCAQDQDDGRVLQHIGKLPNLNLLDAAGEPFETGPLIAQNRFYTRFEIVFNQPTFDYILANKLYNTEGQKLVKSVSFPVSVNGKAGSLILKAAWKILTADDDEGNFHAIEAFVYTPESKVCKKMKVGLVGFHIMHKLKNSPQWVWSTFEHKDNCPEEGAIDKNKKYNYYNPAKPELTINKPPPRPWDPDKQDKEPTQVVRLIPLTKETIKLNEKYHQLLRKFNADTVWQNYILISTQWPTAPTSSTDNTGAPAPQFLGNTTLETYIQGKVPNVSSSCMECHNNATTTTGVSSDFTYILQSAHSKSKTEDKK